MIENEPFIPLFFFILVITSIFLVRYFKSKNKDKPTTNSVTNYQLSNNYSEFEKDDIDKDIDEMPDDCLIYDDLFGNS